jgi:ribosomal protein S18 acetylase RimI-like enzyme
MPVDQGGTATVLARLETYLDAVPRPAARAEPIGPFTLFVQAQGGWPYYARPSVGAAAFTAAAVDQVRARQRALGVPEAFEWVAETTPGLRPAVAAAGLVIGDHPLMVLAAPGAAEAEAPTGVTLRLVTPADDLARLSAVASLAFGAPGTATGEAGTAQLSRVAPMPPELIASTRARLAAGQTVMAVAEVDGQPIGVGSHQPLGAVSEVAGIGVLPAFRRRGIAAALTALLARDARGRGAETVFLSAGEEVIARIYARVGFRRIGTACTAEPTPAP